MPAPDSVRELYLRLGRDEWRKSHAFSSDILVAHDVLLDPFATDAQKRRMLALWLKKPADKAGPGHQPCLFGRIAALSSMHIHVMDDNTLNEPDEAIAENLNAALLAWKRRSLDPTLSTAAHGFMILLASRRLAEAAPDERLLNFALAFRRLWGCALERDPYGNDVAMETLYLKKPASDSFVRFTFSVDYFGAQGDGRWWHDHRVPGGVAFTANSAGHMLKCRAWYPSHDAPDWTSQPEWLLQNAMLTIDEAVPTPYGKATWLRPLVGGRPFVDNLACPIAPQRQKAQLAGKDWTRYGGHLYSDHSIRREFFRLEPDKPPELLEKEWLEDFAYLYDGVSKDYFRFVEGEAVTQNEVERELGAKSEWRSLDFPVGATEIRRLEVSAIPQGHAESIARALNIAEGWGQESPYDPA